jgi:hypothetical protein
MSRGAVHKLAFSSHAVLEDIDRFRMQVQADYGIGIQSDIGEPNP